MPALKAVAVGLLLALTAAAQQPAQTTQGGAQVVDSLAHQESPPSKTVIFKKGTVVHLRLAESLSSKTSVVGHLVELVLDEDVKVEDVVLASKGARVIGKVTQGKKDEKRRPGKDLAIQLQYVITPYGRLPLTGEQRGSTKHLNAGAVVASTAALGATGLLIALSATKKILPENAPVVATSADDFEVTVTTPPANPLPRSE